MKKFFTGVLCASFLLTSSLSVSADSQPGDMIVTLGQDLTEQQRSQMLLEMGAPKNAVILEVTNAEEHKYLGNYIPAARIGTRAISSASITMGDKDSGLVVSTNNISWVTNEMYVNALITAGVKDAKIYVTSPIKGVSGTAALTGLIKAYEVSTGEEISEDQKQVANEEMVTSAELADEIGQEETASLMTNIKEKIAEDKPKNEKEMKAIIEDVAKDLDIEIPEDQVKKLTDLFMKMIELDIDWNAVGDQLEVAKEKFKNFIESDEGKGFFEAVKDFFVGIFEAIKGWFTSDEDEKEEGPVIDETPAVTPNEDPETDDTKQPEEQPTSEPTNTENNQESNENETNENNTPAENNNTSSNENIGEPVQPTEPEKPTAPTEPTQPSDETNSDQD